MVEKIYRIQDIFFDECCELFLNNRDSFVVGLAGYNICESLKKNDIVKVTARVQDKRHISIKEITKPQDITLETALYVCSPIWCYEKEFNEFTDILLSVEDVEIRNLIKELFLNGNIIKKFFYYRASIKKKNHHSYKFGLFLHTYEVINHCLYDATYYNLDKKATDILIAAGLFHDIGKCLNSFSLINGHKQASVDILRLCARKAGINPKKFQLINNLIFHTHKQDYDFRKNILGQILKDADFKSAKYYKLRIKFKKCFVIL